MRIAEGLPISKEVRAVIYARVSPSQRGDLEGQVQYLRQYCFSRGYRVVDVLSDIASGLKADRRGLLKLLDYVVNRQVDVIVVAYRDRLTRFGLEYLEYFFRQYGVRVEAALGEEPKDSRQELLEDLIEVVNSFAGRLYGLRSRRRKELVEGFKRLLEEVERGG